MVFNSICIFRDNLNINILGTTVLPVIGNQKMNDYLKDIGKEAGLIGQLARLDIEVVKELKSISVIRSNFNAHGQKDFCFLYVQKGC